MNNYSPLLINEPPLLIIPSLAKAIGLNEAIVVQQLHYWLNNPNIGIEQDGYKWVFNTYEEWAKNFTFWSTSTIQRIFANLEKSGVVITAQLKKNQRDMTKYYRIDYMRIRNMHDSNLTSSIIATCDDVITETTTETTTDKKDVSVERDINKGKVKEIPPSPQRGAETASRGVNSSKQSLLQEDEAPTQERISALKRVEIDRELLAAFNLIHQIAGLSKPVTMNKSDKKLLSDAIKQGVTAERIGNAWKKALETSEARFWPFHCVIEKLHLLEAQLKKKPTFDERHITPEQVEEARGARLQATFDKILGRG